MKPKASINHNDLQGRGLSVKSGVKAGGIRWNHNETQAAERTRGLSVKTSVKASGYRWNHNETQVRAAR